MSQENPFTSAMLESMNIMANGFATERVEGVMNAIENKMKTIEGRVIYSRDSIKGEVGKMLATAYIKGFADAKEGVQPRKIFLPKRIK